jgi:ABC-type uncharacterized transport system substrate-binding protein
MTNKIHCVADFKYSLIEGRIVVKERKKLAILVFVTLLFWGLTAFAGREDQFSTSPKTNNGKKWRVAYYEGGQEVNYYNYLTATVRGLMELGWINKEEIPESKSKNAEEFWGWLCKGSKSRYIEFVEDAFYSAHWDQDFRAKMRKEVLNRLNHKKDIDLILAMGTWAGQDLATEEHSTPIMVMSASDPVKSGIIKSLEDSGLDHVHARVDPFRWERQVRIFHDVVGFKKLGVAYEDSVYGRTYAAIDLVEKVARERNFEIVHCFTESDIADQERAGQTVIDCFYKLAGKVDAIYVTYQGGVNPKTIPHLVKIANDSRIPTFSQSGVDGVKSGFLMSVSRARFKSVGMFEAAIMAKIFNGAKARDLEQLFQEAPNIALNLKTAEIIGLYLYADVLAAADEIFREIVVPE